MEESTYDTEKCTKRGANDQDDDHDLPQPSKRHCNTSGTPPPSANPCPHSHHHQQQQQWLLRRRTESGQENTMIVLEHLGDASTMVESLTHQLDSWSLISRHPKHGIQLNRKTTKERVQASKREVMKALRVTQQAQGVTMALDG